MIHSGDSHNFGQRVGLELGASGEKSFRKPRPVYWEWLFFGQDSPLKSTLLTLAEAGSIELTEALFQSIFRLDVEMDKLHFHGRVRGLSDVTSEPGPQSPVHLYRFGVLLAYAFALGIRDFHRGNLVRTTEGLIPIDVESLFVRLHLPHETLLLPFRDTAYENCGLSRLVPDREDLDIDSIFSLLRGFFAMLNLLADSDPAPARLIHAEIAQHGPIPIRHLLRDTKDYRDWQRARPQIPFLPEELHQLERGDIPYFFKILADERVFYWRTRDRQAEPVEIPAAMLAGTRREAINPLSLLESHRVRATLLPHGILFLARTWVPEEWTGSLRLDLETTLTFSPESIALNLSGHSFSSRRARQTV